MTPAALRPDAPLAGCRAVGFGLLVLSVTLYMMLSAPTLHELGIPYDVPYGPFPAKIHPGTYVLALAFLVSLGCGGNPLREGGRLLGRSPALAYYLASMLLLFLWVVWRHGTSGAAFILETLCTPALMLLTLQRHDEKQQAQVFKLMMILISVNAVMALIEYSFKMRLAPIRSGREDLGNTEYFRSSAFLGHPLVNALVTVSLLPAVTLLPWRPVARVALGALLLVALFTFGGRASLALGGVVYGTLLAGWLLYKTVRGHFSYLQLTGGSVGVLAGLAALSGLVAATGIGDRVLRNLALGDQSADVRLRVWDVFDYVDPVDLWIGLAPSGIDRLALRIGLDPKYEAIENFWIYLLLMFGLIGFALFLPALLTLVVQLWRRAPLAMRAAMVVYFSTASTGNTLAAKDFTLLLLTTAIFTGSVSARRARVAPIPTIPRTTPRAPPHAGALSPGRPR